MFGTVRRATLSVQFWKTQNGGRLGCPCGRGNGRPVPDLVDAKGVRSLRLGLKGASWGLAPRPDSRRTLTTTVRTPQTHARRYSGRRGLGLRSAPR